MSKLLAVARVREALIKELKETIEENAVLRARVAELEHERDSLFEANGDAAKLAAQLSARVAELEACNAGLTKLTLKQNRRVAELEEAIRDFAKYLPPEVNERARAVLAHGSAGR